MGMAKLQLYRNKYSYPNYSESIDTYGSEMDCTPVGVNLKNGSIRVEGSMDDFMNCNYLRITRDGGTFYGWVDNVEFVNDKFFLITYTVDAWRTYKSKINLGIQHVARQPTTTAKRDPLLGSASQYPIIQSKLYAHDKSSKRVFVVQVRAPSGEIFSRTPVNPTPYQFYMVEYDYNNWTSNEPLFNLMRALGSGAQTENIVTMYSIPYMDLSDLPEVALPVRRPDGTKTVPGFSFLGDHSPTTRLSQETDLDFEIDNLQELLRVDHSVQIVIPEGGIIDVPDELLVRSDLRLRQDVDLFSGASNFMLVAGDHQYFTQSVRGSSISSIPIVSDPMDTYLSQNQNALATSLIGDVATVATGIGMGMGTGGLGAGAGFGVAMQGVKGIWDKQASALDAGSRNSNPPAFLGTALATQFNQHFWVVVRKTRVENANQVNGNFGYPIGMVKPLEFPSVGFIQTEGCTVSSTDGTVPRWALDEINGNFNQGILVY